MTEEMSQETLETSSTRTKKVGTDVSELQELCQKILNKLPTDNQTESFTTEFKGFIAKLKDKGTISAYEIKCITRAYNYFNQLMRMNTPDNPFFHVNPDTPTDTSDPSALTTETR